MTGRRSLMADLRRCMRCARGCLDRRARARLGAFVGSCQSAAGGFCGRGLEPDLYYCSFGVMAAWALGIRLDRARLRHFVDGFVPADLDLPHLAAWVQCQRWLHPLAWGRARQAAVLTALQRFRAAEGGFGDRPGAGAGSPYGLYLATLSYELARQDLPERPAAAAAGVRWVDALPEGPGWTLHGVVSAGLAAQALGGTPDRARLLAVLASCQAAEGGFRAHPQAPAGDLLSTAVGAFCRYRLGAPLQGAEAAVTARWVHSLWQAEGGFAGSRDDATPDCEYTFYGLLTMGAMVP